MKRSEYLGLTISVGILCASIINLNNSISINDYIEKSTINQALKHESFASYENRNDFLISSDGTKVSLKDVFNQDGINIFMSPVKNSNHKFLILSNFKNDNDNDLDINFDKMSDETKTFINKYSSVIKKIATPQEDENVMASASFNYHSISLYDNLEITGNVINDIPVLNSYFHEIGHLYHHDYSNTKNYDSFNKNQFFNEAHSDIFAYFSLHKYYKETEPNHYDMISMIINERLLKRQKNFIDNSKNNNDPNFQIYTNTILLMLAQDILKEIDISKKSPDELELISRNINNSFKKYLDENNISEMEIFNLNADNENLYPLIKKELIKNYISFSNENENFSMSKNNTLKI